MQRIELYEKYAPDGNDYSYDWWLENMPEGTPYPIKQSTYRRTFVLVDQIERPIEIPGSKDECIIQFWGGERIIVKYQYDEFCIKLHDIEEQMLIEQQLIQYEIDNAANK